MTHVVLDRLDERRRPLADHLQDALRRLDMSPADLARRSGISRNHASQLLAEATLSPDVALRVSRAIGEPAELLLKVDSSYRAAQMRLRELSDLTSCVDWALEFPLRSLRARRCIDNTTGVDAVTDLLDLFGVASVEAWEDVWDRKPLAFRRAADASSTVKSLRAWLRLGELQAHRIDTAEFDHGGVEEASHEIRTLTELPITEGWSHARQVLAACGVALVLEPQFAGDKINGATNWLRPDKVVIQVSDRMKRADVLWFNVLHEIGHVLHDKKRLIYVGSEVDNYQSPEPVEATADLFARTLLIPRDHEDDLPTLTSIAKIRHFASEIGVGAHMVVGRLLRDEVLGYTTHARYLERFDSESDSHGNCHPVAT